MNKLLVTLLAAASMVTLGGAVYAAETNGTIKAIDAAKNTVTLQDGSVYVLPASVDPAMLKVGAAVTITFEPEGDKKMASKITQ